MLDDTGRPAPRARPSPWRRSSRSPWPTATLPHRASPTCAARCEARRRSPWKLVSAETFGSLDAVAKAAWVRDPHGDASPWHVDHLDDDGQFFDVQGGPDFRRQLAAAPVVRKRVTSGQERVAHRRAGRPRRQRGRRTGEPAHTAHGQPGPGGDRTSYTKQQWPAGSAYPDFFVIGDPHLNFYEGSATVG